MRDKNVKATLIIQVIIIVLSFLLGGLFMLLIMHLNPRTNYVITKDKTKVYDKTSLKKSIDKIYNAVVVVQDRDGDSINNSGTGFVYKTNDKYGYILTNEHVLGESEKVKVIMATDEEVDALVLGKDKYLDLAVLRIDKKYVSLVANIGSSEKMNIGDTIFTVGSPVGSSYRGSVTSGVLSGKDRLVSLSVSSSTSDDWVMQVLQIDASINPGNSGGPLLNVNGEVIGVCTMKLVDDDIEGMGFAVPIEYAISHAKSLEAGKKINWPKLGIGMANINDTNVELYNVEIPDKTKDGVIITSIKKDSSSEKVGLKKGDVITAINDKKIKDKAYLRYELYKYQKGDTIDIKYIRDKSEKKVKVVLD